MNILKFNLIFFTAIFICCFYFSPTATANELSQDLEQHLDFFKASRNPEEKANIETQVSIDKQNKRGKYTNGFKIYQYSLEPGDSVADSNVPHANLGVFIATKSEYSYKELIDKLGIPFDGGRLFRIFGFLPVNEPGEYTIMLISNDLRQYCSVEVNNHIAGKKYSDGDIALIVPVAFSMPGIYPIDFKLYNCIQDDLTVRKSWTFSPRSKLKVMIKTPDSDLPLQAHRVLVLPLSK